jgi:hypothetical protein
MSGQSPPNDLMSLISGFRVSQAISVMAELGLADILNKDALHVEAIAQATQCIRARSIDCFICLASVEVLEELAGSGCLSGSRFSSKQAASKLTRPLRFGQAP